MPEILTNKKVMIPKIVTSYDTISDCSTVVEDLEYKEHFVHKGFVTDFTSTKWYIRWVVPRFGKGNLAAVIHDYYYTAQCTSRKEADLIYKQILIDCGFSRLNATARYYVLRVFGGEYYE